MALSVVGVNNSSGQSNGTTGTGTSAVTWTMPAGTTDYTDRVFIIQVSTGTTLFTTDGPYVQVVSNQIIGSGSVAAGTGQRYLNIWYRDKDPEFTAGFSLGVTNGSSTSNWVGVITIRAGSGNSANIQPTSATFTDYGSAHTSYAPTVGSITTDSGGLMLLASAFNDNVTISSTNVTQSGATFGTVTERADGGTATGNDVAGKIHTVPVTTGATGNMTITGTLSGSSEGGTKVLNLLEATIEAGESIDSVEGLNNILGLIDGNYWNSTNVSGTGSFLAGAAESDANATASLRTRKLYDLTVGTQAILWRQTTATATSTSSLFSGFHEWTGAGWGFKFTSGGTVQAVVNDSATGSTRTHTANDYYRIRYDTPGGTPTIYYEYRPDSGGSWTTLHSTTTVPSRTDRIRLWWSATFVAGTCQFAIDKIQLPPGDPITDLSEDFAAPLDSQVWTTTTQWPTVSGGVATFDADDNLFSSGLYNMTDGERLYWHVSSMSGTTVSIMGVIDTASFTLYKAWYYDSGTMYGVIADGTTTTAESLGVPPNQWYSVRYDTGTIETVWEYRSSMDSGDWIELGRLDASGDDYSHVKVIFGSSSGTSFAVDAINYTPPPPPPAKTITLTDDFGTIDTGKWTAGGSSGYSVTSDSGAARLEYDTSAYYTASLTSVDTYDLTDSMVVVEIPDAGTIFTNAESAAQVYIQSSTDSTDVLRMYVSDTYGIVAQIWNDDVLDYDQSTGNGTYSDTTHRWIRIREDSGTLYFDTAPDGLSWTNQFSTASATAEWDLADIVIILQTQRGSSAGGSPGYSKFDNFNLIPTSKIETLVEDFDIGDETNHGWFELEALDTQWSFTGELEIEYGSETDPGIYGAMWVAPADPFTLQDSSVFWEVTQVYPADDMAVVGFLSIGHYFYCGYQDGNLWFGETGGPITYAPTGAHRWLRLRESSGTVYYDTSPDGLDWTQQHSEAYAGDGSTTDGFAVYCLQSVSSGRTFKMDNLNVDPSSSGNTTEFMFLFR